MERTTPSLLRAQPVAWLLAAGFASTWLVFPLVIGPLGLLRDFWSWMVAFTMVWVCVRQHSPENDLLHALVWGLILAAICNSYQGLIQALALWWPSPYTPPTDVYGFLHQRNHFASLCLMGLIALAWVARKQLGSSKPTLARTMTLAGAVFLGEALSLSGSRTGLLGMIFLWVAYEALAWKCTQQTAVACMRWVLRAGAVGYALALLPAIFMGNEHSLGIWARQDAQEGFNVCNSRLSLWANVLELIRLKPWLGWGWGELEYAHFITPFHSERFCALLSNAHNLPLHLAVELGIPVALAACAAVLVALWRAQPWRERNPDRLLAWGLLLVMGMHSLFEYPLWYGPFQVSAVLSLWILVRTPRQTGAQTLPVPACAPLPHATTRTLQLAMVLGLLGTTFVAADYYRASQIYLPPAMRLGLYREATEQQIQKSLFFQNTIDFAQLNLTEVTADNAEAMRALALRVLHFSPEAMVLQKLLTSTHLLGRQDEYDYYQQRFEAVYPEAYMQWKARQSGR